MARPRPRIKVDNLPLAFCRWLVDRRMEPVVVVMVTFTTTISIFNGLSLFMNGCIAMAIFSVTVFSIAIYVGVKMVDGNVNRVRRYDWRKPEDVEAVRFMAPCDRAAYRHYWGKHSPL